MKKKNKNKLIILLLLVLFVSVGCTKQLTDSDNNTVKNPTTGQSLTENILCQPTDQETIDLYVKNGVDITKLPTCNEFNVFIKWKMTIYKINSEILTVITHFLCLH